jgi:ABC-type antimicrobial peptide transport system permease subunit
MDTRTLILRSLRHYWRTNLAVILGVATASAVLAGALLVGASVRGSLRRLALERIGNTDSVVRAATLFRESLARNTGGVPMIVLEGLVVHQKSGRRARSVAVYGVDARFWRFHGQASPALSGRESVVTESLAGEIGAAPDDTILLRLEKPSDIPAESVFGRKEESAPAIRLTVKASIGFGFALTPMQTAVKAVYMPLDRLQREIGAPGRANVILAGPSSRPLAATLAEVFSLEDLGIHLRTLSEAGGFQLDALSGFLSDRVVDTAETASKNLGLPALPAMTYLATAMKVKGKEVPYSLVAALPLDAVTAAPVSEDSIVLNEWTQRELGALPGDTVTMEYMLWQDDSRLVSDKADFVVAAAVPIRGLAADRNLAPEYPGITDVDNVADWNPPFPMDLGKIRRKDEDYWDTYRTTPKAFVSLARAQKLWRSRWGRLTALRFLPSPKTEEAIERAAQEMRIQLRKSLDPVENGMVVIPLREQSLEASRGATDFGEYFVYFSFFLMASALLLAGLFFRLGVEQRYAEVGLLRAAGLTPGRIRSLFLAEGALLALAGGVAGAIGAVAYASFVLFGLGNWWVDAVGTRDLVLTVSPLHLLGGVLGGVVSAGAAILLTLRGVRSISPRRLLAGATEASETSGVVLATRSRTVAIGAAATGAVLIGSAAMEAVPPAAGFFGAGALMLVALLAAFRSRLASSAGNLVSNRQRLALRSAGHRPGRSVLSAALIASATFLIVSVESFRRSGSSGDLDPKSGSGGFPLMAESVRPIYYDLNEQGARSNLNLPDTRGLRFLQFRLRPGDDASCLNLYEPRNPRILGAPRVLANEKRFSLDWNLLERDLQDGSVPAVADANSLAYVLHKRIGEEILLAAGLRLKIVGALQDSVFQSELLISERNFVKLFPGEQGYRVFLIEAPAPGIGETAAVIENALADHGFDVIPTSEKLASFHRVENTYLSTFQSLGGLGLLLGTIGLAAILFRNVLERRREMALLAAVGYTRSDLSSLVLRENVILLLAGLIAGAGAAAVAIAPVIASRGAHFSFAWLAALLAAVLLTGLAATWAATRVALRLPVSNELRVGG